MPNLQVTHGAGLDDARSESTILINPNNPQQIVGGVNCGGLTPPIRDGPDGDSSATPGRPFDR